MTLALENEMEKCTFSPKIQNKRNPRPFREFLLEQNSSQKKKRKKLQNYEEESGQKKM